MDNKIQYSKPVPPFVKFCAANIPMVFDDSLSYYEALCALWKWMQDNLVDVINNNAAVTDYYIEYDQETRALFIQLKEYVDTYFDNLDVQEEINNKLDAMVEDGTFAQLLTHEVPADTYYFDTQFALLEGTIEAQQGGCMLPDKTMIQFSGQNKVYRIGKDGDILNEATFSHGHCNSCCYNSKTGYVYVVEKYVGDKTKGTIYAVDPLTLDVVETYNITDFPDELYAIVYLEDEEKYCFINWWSNTNSVRPKMWKTDEEFNILETKTFDNIKTITSSNFGKIGNYLAVETLDKSNVLMFDHSMNFVKQSSFHKIIGDVWYNTETEWFDSVGDTLYIACSCGQSADPHRNDTYVYGYCDTNFNYEVNRKGTAILPIDEYYTVDHTSTDLKRNGSTGKPFANIYEALNASLRTDKVSGNVNITVVNNPTDNYYFPLFTMVKKYTIRLTPNVPHNHINGVGVKGADVTFSRGITITPLATRIDPFNFAAGGGDLCILGTLKSYGNITTDDNSQVKICGDERSVARFGLISYGADVTDYYGVLENTTTSSNIAFTGLKTNSAQWFTEIKGASTLITGNNGSYTLPRLSSRMLARVRFQFTGVSTPQPEMIIPICWGVYQEFAVSYDSHSGIIKCDNNTLTMTGGTINRVYLMS